MEEISTQKEGLREEMTTQKEGLREEMTTQKEGLRASKLREAMERALGNMLKKWSYEKISQCFPEIVKQSPESFKDAHTQVIKFLEKSIWEEYERILISRKVVEKLNELDLIIAEAKLRKELNKSAKNTYIPNLDPLQAIRAHIIPIKEKEVEELRIQVNESKRVNEIMIREMMIHEEIIQKEKEAIENIIIELDKAVGISSEIKLDEMRNLIDHIPHSMQGHIGCNSVDIW